MSHKSIKKFLLNLPRFIKQGLVLFLDIAICIISVWLSLVLRLEELSGIHGSQWLAVFFSAGISIPLFVQFGLYRAIFRHIGTYAIASIAKVFILYAVLYFSIFSLIGVSNVPRSLGIMQPILLFMGVCISRYLARQWLGEVEHESFMSFRDRLNVIIYGAGLSGRQLAAALSANKGMVIKGFIDDASHLHGKTINGLTVFSDHDLEGLIRRLQITDVLLALPSKSQMRRSEITNSLSNCGVRVRNLPNLSEIALGRIKINDLYDLDMNDLLGRKPVPPNIELLKKNILNKCVLVTGAGGSIGSELCRQLIKFAPKSLILIDSSEHSLYLIYEELKKLISVYGKSSNDISNNTSSKAHFNYFDLVPHLASVRDSDLMSKIFLSHKPDVVFHAAAYKHVPLVEKNIIEGLRNNVFGTLVCARASIEAGVSHFTLVSTDKAVRPTNIMGASKRIAELILQGLAELSSGKIHQTCFSIVRFGNVLGSSGSVAPLFAQQIKEGGPITLTHLDVTRYFMTIPEASQLVIQANAMAKGGEVFVLDMGEPVRIYDLAARMIYLSGMLIRDKQNPDGDIEIQVTGMRPGEKLFEELLIGDNPQPTQHLKIMKAHEEFFSWSHLERELEELDFAMQKADHGLIRITLKRLVPGYHSEFF
jgi:FlaA1/EpsC-like NDP-sugar epimerase